MLKFNYFYTGAHHIGFAKQYDFGGEDRFLIILADGQKLIIARPSAKNKSNGVNWRQVLKTGEQIQADDLVRALGAGVQTSEKI